jgi:hypothetical protein
MVLSMQPERKENRWRSKLIQPRLRWSKQPIRPAELSEALMGVMLARENILEDVNYNKIVPNCYLVELGQDNYARSFQPIRQRVLKQWMDKLLEHLTTTNSRLGRLEYRFGGPITIEMRPVQNLSDSQARILSCIQPESAAIHPPPVIRPPCLEHFSDGQRWYLAAGTTTIGRDTTCEIHLTQSDVQEKRLVSAQHAYIINDENSWRLFDGSPAGKSSTNGTYVNGIPVPREGILLQDGDLITLAALDPEHPLADTPGVAVLRFFQDCA